MWRFLIDGADIYAPNEPELTVIAPVLKFEDNKAASFTFSLPQRNRFYNSVHKLASVVEVLHDDVLYFRGRPLNDGLDFHNIKKVTCESELAMLNDSLQRPFTFPVDDTQASPEDYLRYLIGMHNAAMPPQKQFTVGEVTVADPNNYIARSDSEYSSTWQLIREGLLDTLGGHLVVRYAEGARYLDYLAELPELSSQPIVFGENLLDISTTRRGEDIATAILPIGATLEETGERLTINSLPDSETDDVCKLGDIVYSKRAEEAYGGRIIKLLRLDDVTTANYLLNRARAELAEKRAIVGKTTLKAADLSAAGYDVQPFMIGQHVYVSSPPHKAEHELQPYYFIEALTVNAFDPAQNTVTVGSTYMSLTDATMQQRVETVQRIIETRKETAEKLRLMNLSIEDLGDSVRENYEYAAGVNDKVVSLQAYIQTGNIGTDAAGNPIIGVSIGQRDLISAFRSVFTASAVEFYQGTDLTAFLSNKKLNVETVRANNIELSDDLRDPQRTDWQITSDSRGLSITYIGG